MKMVKNQVLFHSAIKIHQAGGFEPAQGSSLLTGVSQGVRVSENHLKA